jgi:hypothetical protein
VTAWIVGFALAGDLPTVALVPLDASPGTPSADLEVTIRGIAAALQSEGGIVPVYDNDLALELGEQSEDRLKSARESLSEGRRMLAEGDADIALAFLQEAVTAHTEAGSDVVRRDEAADAHYALGRAMLATYNRDAARGEIRRAIQLVPDYMTARADAVTPDLEALAAEATSSLASRPPRHLNPDGAATLQDEFRADDIVHGTVDGRGNLSLTVQRGATVLYVVERPGPFAPPPVGNDWYEAIAKQVAAACLGEPIPAWNPADHPVATVAHPADPNHPPAVVDPLPTPHKGKATWAIWTVSGVLAAGTAAAVVATTLPAPSTPTETWTLTIEGP